MTVSSLLQTLSEIPSFSFLVHSLSNRTKFQKRLKKTPLGGIYLSLRVLYVKISN